MVDENVTIKILDWVDRLRIWPRSLITLYGFMFYYVCDWFMTLPNPTNAQSAFVSVVVGAGAAWFGLYCGSGPVKKGK
jgi:hypothetical protein